MDSEVKRRSRKFIMREKTGAERAADMLKARLDNKPFTTEMQLIPHDLVTPAKPITELRELILGLVTAGAIVPKGNPDKVATSSQIDHVPFGYWKYSIEGVKELAAEEWEGRHPAYQFADPNYGLPLPAARELEAKGVIKGVLPFFLSFSGCCGIVADCKRVGTQMAQELKRAGAGGALIVSTGGTCTRCAATTAKEIEQVGLPAVMITSASTIALAVGANRVVQGGRAANEVCGDSTLSHEDDRRVQLRLVETALKGLQTRVKGPTLIKPSKVIFG